MCNLDFVLGSTVSSPGSIHAQSLTCACSYILEFILKSSKTLMDYSVAFLSCRNIPLIRVLARASMHSIIIAHPTLHITWQTATPALRHPPQMQHTSFRNHHLASPVKQLQILQQVITRILWSLWGTFL